MNPPRHGRRQLKLRYTLFHVGGCHPLFKGVRDGYREFVIPSNQFGVQSMMQDTVRSSTACQPITLDATDASSNFPARPAPALSWRHAATVLLLLVAFPVLLLSAALTLPLLLLFLCADGMRKLLELDLPLRDAPSH